MNAPVEQLSEETAPGPKAIRGPELGPAPKRDLVLQRVRAARKRLAPIPNALPRLR
ncbi:MAG TPA: hypothetical protein VFT79_02275 [Solirubrobacterales bacterium]|nr:hypothetical protein [Solirubrobacterales bacterium]